MTDGTGMPYHPAFAEPGGDGYEGIDWKTDFVAEIRDANGGLIFQQEGIEAPPFWSQQAVNVVASKYFRGEHDTPEREGSVRGVINRVVNSIALWGWEDGYFRDEESRNAFAADLCWLLVRQHGAFNSPVWFNAGISDNPQISACFILSVEDTMESILDLSKTEGLIFRDGSGAGTNLSTIRSTRDKLSGGGTPSGPVSFMKGYDAFAGVIRSGGKVRRAAKMQILNVDHPDIMPFIRCKMREEAKAYALVKAGYSGGMDGEAYESIAFQNANLSVMVPDAFMEAVERDEEWPLRLVRDADTVVEMMPARKIMRAIADGTWACGDPGMQFGDTMNRWNPVLDTERIVGTNPCVTGDTLVATAEGLQRIDSLLSEPFEVVGGDGAVYPVQPAFPTGRKKVYRLRTQCGYHVDLTEEHLVQTQRGDVPAGKLEPTDTIQLVGSPFGDEALDDRLADVLGTAVGNGCVTGRFLVLTITPDYEEYADSLASAITEFKREDSEDGRTRRGVNATLAPTARRISTCASCVVDPITRLAVLDQKAPNKQFTDAAFRLNHAAWVRILQGLFTADGTVGNYSDKSQYISLDSTSIKLLEQVQLVLLGFGVKSKIYRDRRGGQTTTLLPDGRGGVKEYPVHETHSLRISRSSRVVFEKEVGFVPGSPKAQALREMNASVGVYRDRMQDKVESVELIGEMDVFDLQEPVTEHFVGGGIVVHNCSEYAFVNDSACNLASLNLMRFRGKDGRFQADRFRSAVRTFILAMDILVDRAKYPTEKVARNSHYHRPLGLGFANLGAYLMAQGMPYDSDEARDEAAGIADLMMASAMEASADLAEVKGPCESFAENAGSFQRVFDQHLDAHENIPMGDLFVSASESWCTVKERFPNGVRSNGVRNAQLTLLAPTGTIAFMMDCDTTSGEPDIALVKIKNLVGGGNLKIVNQTVPVALHRLGYSPQATKQIVDYIDQCGTIEGAPGIQDEHLAVFDCALKPKNGERFISHWGHIRMMAAIQPFLSGAISKTVNVPESATVEDIEGVYQEAWKLGLKAVAIYRNGSKQAQALTLVGEDKKEKDRSQPGPPDEPVRHRLPDNRKSITHKFRVGNHKGYFTVGHYPDGTPGEVFVRIAKEGSMISGLMDSYCTAVSMMLQYGVPLQVIIRKFAFVRFEPSGWSKHPDVKFARSVVDYMVRWLDWHFYGGATVSGGNGNGHEDEDLGRTSATKDTVAFSVAKAREVMEKGPSVVSGIAEVGDTQPCSNCGGEAIRMGSCYFCYSCLETSGCS